MEKTIIALLAFFVVTAYNKPINRPYKIALIIEDDHDFVANPCFLLKMKTVQNNKRTLGLGTCCDQDQYTDFRTVKGQAGGTTTLKIMSNDTNYVLTDRLEFVNTASTTNLSYKRVYFKTGLSLLTHIERISLQTMSSPFKYIAADYYTKNVTLIGHKAPTTSFSLELKSYSNSSCNEIFHQNRKYCQLIKNNMNCN